MQQMFAPFHRENFGEFNNEIGDRRIMLRR